MRVNCEEYIYVFDSESKLENVLNSFKAFSNILDDNQELERV